MCGRRSQSVVSSQFDFTPAFTIAHELGHRYFLYFSKKTIILQQYLLLSGMIYVVRHYLFGVEYLIIFLLLCSFGCEHDGENNTCPEDGHVMNSTSARNTSNIWQFSSCSESYIKTLLHKLDR